MKNLLLYMGRILPRRVYVQLQYYLHYKHFPNLETPKTFNEKIQWLKLNAYHEKYSLMVDKYRVKRYVCENYGSKYVIPCLGCWDDPCLINFDELPNTFVLKCNHNSGGLFICRDKSLINKKKVISDLQKSLKKNGYWYSRELPYKYVKPCVFAEEYVEDKSSKDLIVYKFFTFNGVAKIIQVIQNDKRPEESIDYFDCDWNLLKMRQNFPNSKNHLNKPENFDEMLSLANKMAKKENVPFLRIDLYQVNGKILFSEFTFYTDAGMSVFYPSDWDTILGDWLKI